MLIAYYEALIFDFKSINMRFYFYIIFISAFRLFTLGQQHSFVRVDGSAFTLEGKPYRFIGANFWYGMHLGAGDEADRGRLIRELDRLQEIGVTNLRIMAASEGAAGSPYQNHPTVQSAPGIFNEQMLAGLDLLLSEMSKRNMKAVVCLGNFWMWSGGFSQYISWANKNEIPFPDVAGGGSWDQFINYTASFYSNKQAVQYYQDYIKMIVNRINSISGKSYINDPTIMSWQLANEPRGYSDVESYRKWIRKTSKLIQSLDKNHLVCIGTEGDTSTKSSGTDLYLDNKSKFLDYTTAHLWIQNWGWFDPKDTSGYENALDQAKIYLDEQIRKAEKLKKPLIFEEFGISRDFGDFDPQSSTVIRDGFYHWMFDYTYQAMQHTQVVQGCNFWAWAGEGRPSSPGGWWKQGDDLIGDPAHELQGWYSVYDQDLTTLQLVRKFNKMVIELN